MEGPHENADETWAPDESLWIPVMFWKTMLMRILILPVIDHGENKKDFSTQLEDAFRSRQLAKLHQRWIPNPNVAIRLLIDEKRRESLIHSGTTEKELQEAGIRESEAELQMIRFWY
ncbi:MAG: hypothetical protein Q9169_007706, partial [Polycauliona sp. 2 TL-2023]